MKKIRINALARELKVKPHLIVELLADMGVSEKLTHASSINEDLANKLRVRFGIEVSRDEDGPSTPHRDGYDDAIALTEEQVRPAINRVSIPVAPVAYHANGRGTGTFTEPGESPARLAKSFSALRRHSWKILSFIAVSTVAVGYVSSRLTPVYESTATIDIDRHTPIGIIGQESAQYPTADADQFLATQLKLITSDSVLRPVVEQFKLPVHPVARPGEGKQSRANPEDAPLEMKDLRVTRLPNTYLLLVRYRSVDPALAADVANGIAASYISHSYTLRSTSAASLSAFMDKQLAELRAKLQRSSAALAKFERELNLINPDERISISSSRLLQLNTEYTSAQSDRVKKEAALNSLKSGSMEAVQVSTQGDVVKKLTQRLGDAQESFAQAKTHYAMNHPEYRRAQAQITAIQQELDSARQSAGRAIDVEFRQAADRENMLRYAVAQNKADLDTLNAQSLQYQAVKRDAESDRKLYQELTSKIKEAEINAGFQNRAIRIADKARPAVRPVFPNVLLNVLLAFLGSTILAVAAALLSDALDHSVRDPRQVSRVLNADVIGTLPSVKHWRRHGWSLSNEQSVITLKMATDGSTALMPLSAERPAANFDDAIRIVLNSILLGNPHQPLKSILIGSAFPKEGKTTVATHLAIAHAQHKHRTLLIDCDLRCPGVSRLLGISSEKGLSNALRNGMKWRSEITPMQGLPELDTLGVGPVFPGVIDIVGKALPQILAEARSEYDLVIVDAPPLLGFPEPLQMAAAVDGVVVVARAGHTHSEALDSLLGTLQRIRANLVGLVLNEVRSHNSEGYQYYAQSRQNPDYLRYRNEGH